MLSSDVVDIFNSIIGEFLNVDRESVLPDDNGVRFNLLKN